MTHTPKKIAVLLAGSGAKDGSEITESVSLLIGLSLCGLDYQIFSPTRNQEEVVNHSTGLATAESRSMLDESNRIARGQAKALSSLNVHEFSGLAIAGGFGTAKNLCTYACDGSKAKLFPDVESVLLSFIKNSKPIAALCIAPLVIALAYQKLGVKGVTLTLGDGSAEKTVSDLESWGARHVICGRRSSLLDAKHQVITAPAYMYADATPADIFKCTESLVQTLCGLLTDHGSETAGI
jgi:enhancing lycopene biosynthesis protein 2